MSKIRLQDEIKKKLPFDVPEQEAILNILRTSDQFQNRFGRSFCEYDLTHSQYNVLRILRGEGEPMPCQEIGDRMIQVVPAMTGLLDRLENRVSFIVNVVQKIVESSQLTDRCRQFIASTNGQPCERSSEATHRTSDSVRTEGTQPPAGESTY